MYEGLGLFIDGRWRAAADGRTLPVRNPASEEALGEVPSATAEDVTAAIEAAARAQPAWAGTQPWERARIIRRIADLIRERAADFRRMVALELGRPAKHVDGETMLTADQFEWFSEETKRLYGQTVESRLPGGRITVTSEPVGVVAAFTAWNFPMVLLARKIAPALAAGCAIVCRPSEETPGTAMLLIRCCADAGVPPGLVNLVIGKARLVSDVVMGSPLVRKVSLTGSTDVGKAMVRASADTLKRVTMELGGHAPVIVCEDADIDAVAALSVQVKFRNAGQVCVSPSRFFVHESRLDAFTERFVAETKKLKVGDPLADDTDVGPLGSRKRLAAIEALVEETRAAGGTVRIGGHRSAGFNKGFFYDPTVITDVTDDMRLMREEIFGPVVPIASFRSVDEVLVRANATEYGLSSYLFTRDLTRAHAMSAGLRAGMVGVNTFALAAAEVPFGGIRDSGFGREGGSQGIRDYLETKYTHMVI